MAAVSFARLGIVPTNDQKTIRRAYAAALKRIDQTADPEGFAALRGAYEYARAWAEHQQAGPDGLPMAGEAGPPDQARQAAAPEFGTLIDGECVISDTAHGPAQTSGSEHAGPQAPWPHQDAPPASDARADPQPPSPAELEEGTAHWTRRLMQTPDDEVAQTLDSALAAGMLGHLEARDALARSVAQALREQPDGRLVLFNTARRVFDWNGFSVPFPHDPELSNWVAMLLDQIEHYGHLPLPLRVRLDAVLMLAHRLAAPNPAQALWHGQDFERLLSFAPDLTVLDLGRARIQAWRGASARFARIREGRQWLIANKMKLVLAAVCLMGLALMYKDFRDGTTYEKPQPTRAQLVNGLVTVQALRAAPEAQPCAPQSMLTLPLGCPAPESPQTMPEPWPTAMPKTLLITEKPNLPYPQDAKSRAAKGKVWVRVMLDAQGKVQRSVVQFSSGDSALDQAAVETARGVRMMPAMQDGNAVPGQALLMFDYQMDAS
ncbi:energy transducer TonB [Achromobacter aegrifaciens]